MNKCSIVKDLLSMYIENLTSEESSEMIKQHLSECSECQNEYGKLKTDIKIPTSNIKKKKGIEALKKTIFIHYILSYILIIGIIFATISIQFNVPFLIPIIIISLFACGFMSQIIIKNIYTTSIITIICTYIVANNSYTLSYNFGNDIFFSMFPLKPLIIFIIANLFYILCGYFISSIVSKKKIKIIPTVVIIISIAITSIPNKYYGNLLEKMWIKALFVEKVEDINKYIKNPTSENIFQLTDFKYIRSNIEGWNYIGYMRNQKGDSYKMVAYGYNIGFGLISEYDYIRYIDNSNESKILMDTFINKGLKFSGENDIRVNISNKNGTQMINPYTDITEIEVINKYNIFTPYSDDTKIELGLNLRQYLEDGDIKNIDDFVNISNNIIKVINELPLYCDTFVITAYNYMEDGTYKLELTSDNIKSINIEQMKQLSKYKID